MLKYFFLLLLGNALILSSFMFLQGTMLGAIPAVLGVFLSMFGLGEILEPFNKRLFQEP